MTRKARNPTMYAKYGNHYVAEGAKCIPDGNPKAYPTIPESYPKILGFRKHQKPYTNVPYPDGLVDIYGENGIMGPRVRRISPEYLDQRFKGKSTVADRQRYIQKIIDNPRSPAENVGVAVRYVRDKPYLFIPEVQSPMYSDDINRIIDARNGSNPEAGFVSRLSAMFPRVWSR